MNKMKDIFIDYHDGDFLCPKSGAKLASLFSLDQAESQGNESFQFTAPKQPKKTCSVLGSPSQKAPPPPCAPAVLFATAVHAFCFVSGKYVKQGRIGAAVLGNHVTKEYKILLYGSQQRQITTARIHRGFVLTVNPCNYATFYDDQQQNWSLMFDSEKARPEFCKEVCIARWNSEPSPDCLVTQDLVQGDGQAVNVGDTVEVAFTGWLLQNHSVGQIFDSNLGKDKLQRVKLGAGKALRGLEEGIIGMQRGGRRLLIIPSRMGYGSKGVPNRVPPTSTLFYDVEIHRVKFSKDRLSGGLVGTCIRSSGSSSDTLSVSNQLTITDINELADQTLRRKLESISEHQTNPDASKAKLISRIAKMGQPIFPFLNGTIPAQADPNDLETENAGGAGVICDPSPSHSPKPPQLSCCSSACRLSSQPVDAQIQERIAAAVPPPAQSNSTHGFQPHSFSQIPYASLQLNPFTSSQNIPNQSPDITSFLVSDARQHNTEILLAIEKVVHRMDQLTWKVDELRKESCFSQRLSSVSLETNIILHNIQRLIQESLCLKKKESSQVEEQYHKTEELIGQNHRNLEQSSQLLNQRSDTLESNKNQTLLLQSEQEKLPVAIELKCDNSFAEQKKLELTITQLQKQCEDLKRALQKEKQQLDARLAMQVKHIVNGIFHSLSAEFDMQESYTGRTVVKILLETIKNVTVSFLSESCELQSDEDVVQEYLFTGEMFLHGGDTERKD